MSDGASAPDGKAGIIAGRARLKMRAHEIVRLLAVTVPPFGDGHRVINGEVYPICDVWVRGAIDSAQGQGLIVSALMDLGQQSGMILVLKRGNYQCQLHHPRRVYVANAPCLITAIISAYQAVREAADSAGLLVPGGRNGS